MFAKKFWIPVILVMVGVAIGGTFLGQHIARQAPTPMIPPTAAPVDAPKPPPPGETHETGHWHGDYWHAEPHEVAEPTLSSGQVRSDGIWYPDNYTPADIAADLAGEGAATDEEYQRRAMKNLVNNYLREHREKYPDCTEHEAILADAIAKAEWVLVDERHVDRYNQLNTEHDFLLSHLKPLLEKYNHRPAYEATHIPEPERLNDVERIKTLMADMKTNREQMNNLMREKPISPKPMHTH